MGSLGAKSGWARHHSWPRCASRSVALLAPERWLPREGGGGRREVSGTAVCQSWLGGGLEGGV